MPGLAPGAKPGPVTPCLLAESPPVPRGLAPQCPEPRGCRHEGFAKLSENVLPNWQQPCMWPHLPDEETEAQL